MTTINLWDVYVKKINLHTKKTELVIIGSGLTWFQAQELRRKNKGLTVYKRHHLARVS